MNKMSNSHNVMMDNNMNIVPSLPQPIQRGGGRKKAKAPRGGRDASQKIKKQPMRGMGVAKLERLSALQERLKNMSTHINPDDPFPIIPHDHHHHHHHHALIDGSCSFQFPRLAGFGAPSYNNTGLVSDHAGLFGSKELSSVTTLLHSHERCFSCQKKKRGVMMNGENMIGYCSSERSNLTGSLISSGGFMGSNVKGDQNGLMNNMMIKAEEILQGPVGTKLALQLPQLGYAAAPTPRPGVEVVAVHRKSSSSVNPDEGSTVLMEYEFFPSSSPSSSASSSGVKDGMRKDSHINDELVLMKVSEASVSSPGFGIAPSKIYTSTSSIDLSLKLSY